MLRHLILIPQNGLANRMRAVASAIRLCERRGARCTIVWDGYRDLFMPHPGVEYVSHLSDTSDRDRSTIIRHKKKRDGGTWRGRMIPAGKYETVILYSGWTFGDDREILPVLESDISPWLPQPSEKIRAMVDAFMLQQTALGRPIENSVGFHVRSTDNAIARKLSPIRLFFRAADRLSEETTIFLATDDIENERAFRERYGDRVVSYPKNLETEKRWPREHEKPADDLLDALDLSLLARTSRIVGSAGSSYSRLAILSNGSPKSVILCRGFSSGALAERIRAFLLRRSIMNRQ